MNQSSDENPIPLMLRPYAFVPRRVRSTEKPMLIHKNIGLTEQNYERIKRYAKSQKVSFGRALNRLMDLAEVADAAPIIPTPQPKPLHMYESFSLMPKPRRRRKKSIDNQPG